MRRVHASGDAHRYLYAALNHHIRRQGGHSDMCLSDRSHCGWHQDKNRRISAHGRPWLDGQRNEQRELVLWSVADK